MQSIRLHDTAYMHVNYHTPRGGGGMSQSVIPLGSNWVNVTSECTFSEYIVGNSLCLYNAKMKVLWLTYTEKAGTPNSTRVITLPSRFKPSSNRLVASQAVHKDTEHAGASPVNTHSMRVNVLLLTDGTIFSSHSVNYATPVEATYALMIPIY